MNASVLKPRRENRYARAGFLLAALLLAATAARAATPTYYWDTNGSDDGAGNPPDGDWYETSTNWTLDVYGTSPTFYYSNRADIVFAATGEFYWDPGVDFSYTVNVNWTAPVGNILFRDGNCTLATAPGCYLNKSTPFIRVSEGPTATINAVIASAPGTSEGITKFDFGTLVLGATNTYRGPTTVEGGTLRLAGPQLLPKTSNLVLAGGDARPDPDGLGNTPPTFHTGGYSQTLGALSLTGPNPALPHTIDFGHGASALVFADSHTQDWGGIILYIAHFKPGADSLRFGTNSSGLSPAQLALIRFTSSLEVPGRIDANGFVTPVPPPTLAIAPGKPTGMTLTWDAITNRTYNLQYKLSPDDALWITNAITDIVAMSPTVSYTDNSGTNGHRVYRLRLKALSEGT